MFEWIKKGLQAIAAFAGRLGAYDSDMATDDGPVFDPEWDTDCNEG